MDFKGKGFRLSNGLRWLTERALQGLPVSRAGLDIVWLPRLQSLAPRRGGGPRHCILTEPPPHTHTTSNVQEFCKSGLATSDVGRFQAAETANKSVSVREGRSYWKRHAPTSGELLQALPSRQPQMPPLPWQPECPRGTARGQWGGRRGRACSQQHTWGLGKTCLAPRPPAGAQSVGASQSVAELSPSCQPEAEILTQTLESSWLGLAWHGMGGERDFLSLSLSLSEISFMGFSL